MVSRQYELVYILPPDTTEQQVTDLHGQLEQVVDRTRTKRQSNSERRRVKRGLPPVRQPGEGRSRDAEDEDNVYSGLEIGPDEGA